MPRNRARRLMRDLRRRRMFGAVAFYVVAAWAFVQAASEQKWLELHGGTHRAVFYTDYANDLQRRFFDHFLKGAPAPEWMEKGIPYLQKEKEKEKYRATEEGDEP